MAKRKKKINNVYIKVSKRLLVLTGKPFYFLIYSVTFILYIIGHFARTSFEKIIYIKLPKVTKIKLPQIKLAKYKKNKTYKNLIKFSKKISLPKLNFKYKKNKNYKLLLKLVKQYKRSFANYVGRKKISLLKVKLPDIPLSKKKKIIAISLSSLIIFIFASWYFVFRDLPSPRDLTNRKIELTTKIYDRNGILLYQI